jgi:aldehyde:ferredoxin oxidoreductase
VASSERIKVLRDYGTASTVMLTQNLGGLPTRNFSQGRFDGAEALSGEALRDLILTRGGAGTPTEACMAGCVIQCSNIMPDAAGGLAVAPMEFETLGLCGSNLGLDSLDAIARINRLCNDLGLDTIEIGAALGVMMEAADSGQVLPDFDLDELPRFGDGERAAKIVAEIEHGGRLGMLVGQGVVAVGRALGVRRVPAVKGQAMSAYDPRVVKGTGVTYATSPQGADHTAGLTVFAPVNHLDPAGAVALSRTVQVQRAAYDALGLCVFNLGATGPRPDVILEMLNSAYGVQLPAGWLNELGRRVIDIERAYNLAAGFTSEDDRLPAFFTQEPLASTGSVFDVPADALDRMWD